MKNRHDDWCKKTWFELKLNNCWSFKPLFHSFQISWRPRGVLVGLSKRLLDIVTLSQVSKCLLSMLSSLKMTSKRVKLNQNWFQIGYFFGFCTILFCASLVLFRLFGCAGEASFAAAGRLRRELRASCPGQERMELKNSKLETILWDDKILNLNATKKKSNKIIERISY